MGNKKDADDVPVVLKQPNKKIKNNRAERQEGLFTWMPRARSFYLKNGSWPGIENYNNLNEEEFILKKYVIRLNNEIISYVQKKLIEMQINKETMGLGEESYSQRICLDI